MEYGSDKIEMHIGAVEEGQRVLLIDDLIATGGTMAAGIQLMKKVNFTLRSASASLLIGADCTHSTCLAESLSSTSLQTSFLTQQNGFLPRLLSYNS